ncbi:MAG: choice-of-anchor Q domain-containing protein [Pirellulales bacterium]
MRTPRSCRLHRQMRRNPKSTNRRSLRFEPLEDRRLLAVFTVSNLNDTGADSLRAAIDAANSSLITPDTIQFSVSGTIHIESQLPTITDDLVILGPGQHLLTIDAGHGADNLFATGDGFRIFNIDNGNSGTFIDVTLSELTLTGGDTAKGADGGGFGGKGEDGGAIRSFENLIVFNSTISGNAAGAGGAANGDNSEGGFGGGGGGIYSDGGALTVVGSTISGNRAGDGGMASGEGSVGGDGGRGGGIFIDNGALAVDDSTISGNRAGIGGVATGTFSSSGYGGGGGGISQTDYSGTLSITGSTISGNSANNGGGINAGGRLTVTNSAISSNTAMDGGDGGGIFVRNVLTVTSSAISGNMAIGGGNGGGIYLFGNVSLASNVSGSTISGNHSAAGEGGGILVLQGTLVIEQSTITGNTASQGGGVAESIDSGNPRSIRFSGSIVSGNSNHDILKGVNTSLVSLGYNLIGTSDAIGVFTADATNLINVDPLLGPLANNGGPTKTHALLPGSPALDAGNPNFDPGNFAQPIVFDQRGDGYARLVDGGGASSRPIVDIGAYESQGVPTGFPDGDYNHDGVANAADYTVWRNSLGLMGGGLPANGDSMGASQNKVDRADYVFWKNNYGNTLVPTATPSAIPLILPTGGPTGDDGIANSLEVIANNGPLGVDDVVLSLLVTSAFAEQNARTASHGLPNDGFFPSTALHPDIQLGYRDANNGKNTLRLDTLNEAVTIDVPDGAYSQLDLAAMSGFGLSDFNVTLLYADGSEARGTVAPDWFDDDTNYGTSGVVSDGATIYYLRNGMDRVSASVYEQSADPALFGFRFAVDPGRTLQIILIRQLDTNNSVLNILGGALKPAGAPGAGAGAAASILAAGAFTDSSGVEANGPNTLQTSAAEREPAAAAPGGVADEAFRQLLTPASRSVPPTRPASRPLRTQAQSTPSDDRLLLVVDRAVEELGHDPGRLRWRISNGDASDNDEQPAPFGDPLATPLVDLR